ncbi:MAG: helix-turn-helix transcriptional regulator [Sphingomonadaceae bacterium]|nr:helix-turn-helix transcriptional regulator [Sphingomonadaceae bacterium]
MHNQIRTVRKARRLTLEQVAARCTPPTTAQTIGRLEMGTRVLSLGWLNRIAAALDVEPRALLNMAGDAELPICAVVAGDGAHAPTKAEMAAMPFVEPDMVGIRFAATLGDYRRGDQLWCRRLARADIAQAINRDILVPRPQGRFIFGRLLAIDAQNMQILPLADGARQQVVAQGDWLALPVQLVRQLGA